MKAHTSTILAVRLEGRHVPPFFIGKRYLFTPVRVRIGRFLQNHMSADNSTTSHVSLDERIKSLVLESLDDENYFLVKLIVRGYRGARAVEVYVDSDTGALVNELAAIGRRLRFLIDSEAAIDGKYTMTVSSPGDQYAFIMPRQYTKYVGKTLDIQYKLSETVEETVSVQGSLETVSGESLILREKDGNNNEILIDRIKNAKVVLPW